MILCVLSYLFINLEAHSFAFNKFELPFLWVKIGVCRFYCMHAIFYVVMACHFLFPLQGIEIKSPFQWPYNKGLSFSCWLRVENFPENGMMGLFSFCTDDGRGHSAMLSRSALVYEVMLFLPSF